MKKLILLLLLSFSILPLVYAKPYVAKLPTIVIEDGVDVGKALTALYNFNPVDMQGLDKLVITPKKGFNCNGALNTVCWGLFKQEGNDLVITIFEAEKQLETDNAVLFSSTLLHELGHLSAWNMGDKGNLYGHLDEGLADECVQNMRFCTGFAAITG